MSPDPSEADLPRPDFAAVKRRQQALWSSGDYGSIASLIVPMAELLCEALDLRAGEAVLDVATGTGNAAIAAARRFCDVTGLDYVPALLARAGLRAEAEGLRIDLVEGDAEDLPFPDGHFDVVVSTVGAMFAPHQERVAAEMLRVCRAGGRIGMANWVAEGYVGHLFAATARHVPPPPGLRSPVQWGDESRLRELFGPEVTIRATRRVARMPFHSSEHWIDLFSRAYGPTVTAFEAVGDEGRKALRDDLVAVVERLNVADDGTLVIPGAYLEVVVDKP